MVVVVLVVVISPPSIFTLRSLRLLASPVKSDGWRPRCFVMSSYLLSRHDAVVGAQPRWFIERSCAVGGRNPLEFIQLLRDQRKRPIISMQIHNMPLIITQRHA